MFLITTKRVVATFQNFNNGKWEKNLLAHKLNLFPSSAKSCSFPSRHLVLLSLLFLLFMPSSKKSLFFSLSCHLSTPEDGRRALPLHKRRPVKQSSQQTEQVCSCHHKPPFSLVESKLKEKRNISKINLSGGERERDSRCAPEVVSVPDGHKSKKSKKLTSLVLMSIPFFFLLICYLYALLLWSPNVCVSIGKRPLLENFHT